MSESLTSLPEEIAALPSSPIPPAIRLVRAFEDAVNSSQASDDLLVELFEVGCLMIAGEAALDALTRSAELWHEATYDGADVGEERLITDGYLLWWKLADRLGSRVLPLNQAGYRAELFDRFEGCRRRAREGLQEAGWRRKLDQGALRSDQLAALASKLRPLQDSYDGEVPG